MSRTRPIVTEVPIISLDPILGLKEEEKPGCFGCYAYRNCKEFYYPVTRETCLWSERCRNSQRDC